MYRKIKIKKNTFIPLDYVQKKNYSIGLCAIKEKRKISLVIDRNMLPPPNICITLDRV